MSERKLYPGDLSGEQWSLIRPVITAWKVRHRSVSGHQGAYTIREVANSIRCQGRTGYQCAYLPHALPPKSAASSFFAAWRDDGTDRVSRELLRFAAHGGLLGIDAETVEPNPHREGLAPPPKRRRVDETHGTLTPHRRPVRDYKRRPPSPASRIYWATTPVMARRLTSANTPTWRAPKAVTA